jgi:hypothetical protein
MVGHIKDPQWAVGNGGNSLVETKQRQKKKKPPNKDKNAWKRNETK